MNATRRTEISLTEETIAVRYAGRWEIYSVLDGYLEIFSHYATAGEAAQLDARVAG